MTSNVASSNFVEGSSTGVGVILFFSGVSSVIAIDDIELLAVVDAIDDAAMKEVDVEDNMALVTMPIGVDVKVGIMSRAEEVVVPSLTFAFSVVLEKGDDVPQLFSSTLDPTLMSEHTTFGFVFKFPMEPFRMLF